MMTTVTDFAKRLTQFFSEYLTHERNLSINTITSYREAFVQFINYMSQEKSIKVECLSLKHLTRENILGYLRWVMDKLGNSGATRNYRLAAIHSFVSFLQYHDIDRIEQWQLILSIESFRCEKKPMGYLQSEGLKLLFEQPDQATRQGRRHLTLLTLMFETAARVQEICDIRMKDLRIESKPYSIVLHGKGKKSRVVPLSEEQVPFLRRYIEENGLDDRNKLDHHLFFNTRGEKLTRQGISYILSKYTESARAVNPTIIPDNISCHSIRHSKAMALVQAGVNIVYIRDILGHVSIQTTDIYARADSKAKRDALEAAYKQLAPEPDVEAQWEGNTSLIGWLKNIGK